MVSDFTEELAPPRTTQQIRQEVSARLRAAVNAGKMSYDVERLWVTRPRKGYDLIKDMQTLQRIIEECGAMDV